MENKDFFIIKKCDGLRGEVSVSGCKNAALPIMAATILSGGKTTLKNAWMGEAPRSSAAS